ncbi:MAG: hypothetical protein RLZZ387_4513 [Chloroflexota bacterium]
MPGPTFPDDLLQQYRHAFLRHEPLSHARMTPSGFRAKYLRDDPTTGAPYGPITDADLAAHLAGEVTLAAVLQRDGRSHVAACDLDTGGEATLRRVVQAAERRGCHATAFALDAGQHDGGHVWIVFREAHPAEDLRALMRDILADAGVPGLEVYPSGADLRLPFGLHRRQDRRGQLLLHSEAPGIAIDADPVGALTAFLQAYQETDAAPVAQAHAAQQERAAASAVLAARVEQALPLGAAVTGADVIRAYNAATDLVALLEGYGARVVHHYAGGRVLLHCAVHQDHRNGDQHPSLIVQPGTGRQTGKLICGCYSPNCRLHNRPGQVKDAFEVYCILEGIDRGEGVKRQSQRLRPPSRRGGPLGGAGLPPRTPPAPPSDGHPPTQASGVAPDQPAQHELSLAPDDVVITPAPSLDDDWRAAVQSRLTALQRDPRARPMDRRLYAFFAERCTTGSRCRPSNAAAAEALGVPLDTIKFTKRRLCELGYITVSVSTDGRNTSQVQLLPPSTQGEGGVIARSPESKLGIGSTRKGGGNSDAITPRMSPAPRQDAGNQGGDVPIPPSPPLPPHVTPGNARQLAASKQSDLATLTHQDLHVKRGRLLGAASKAAHERQRFALLRLAAEIDDELARRQLAALGTVGQGVACAENQTPALECAPTSTAAVAAMPTAVCDDASHARPLGDMPGTVLTIASPDAPHPPLSDAQLTALVRRGLRERVRSPRRLLVEQVEVRREERAITLICPAIAPVVVVEQELAPLVPAVLAELGIAATMPNEVQVRRGVVTAARGERPHWLAASEWASLPVAAKALFTGASIVGTTLYGATPRLTSGLAEDRSGAIAWVLNLVGDDVVESAATSGTALGDVAVGEVGPAVAHGGHQLAPRVALAEAGGDPAVDVLLGEERPEAVQALAVDPQLVAGLPHGVLEPPGQAPAVAPEVVAAGRDVVDRLPERGAAGIVEGRADDPRAPTLGVGTSHGDGAGLAIEVLLTQPCDLVVAEPRGAQQAEHARELEAIVGVTRQALGQPVCLTGAVTASWSATTEAGVELRGNQLVGRDRVPPQVVQRVAQLPQAAQRVLDVGLRQPLGAHAAGDRTDVGDGELAEHPRPDLGGQTAERGDAALLVGAEALPRVDELVGDALLLGAMPALADPCAVVEGLADLLDEARALAHGGLSAGDALALTASARASRSRAGVPPGSRDGEAGGERHPIGCLSPSPRGAYNAPHREGLWRIRTR